MMRNTLQSKASANIPTQSYQVNPDVPSIRLVAATPSASGLSSEANTSNTSWSTVPLPSALSPRSENDSPRRKLVPKKSKLGLLGSNGNSKDKVKERGTDFSDVIRRVGGSSARRGFDIYVDPTDDPEMGEIVMVKKKKSRAGLDGMRWGSGGALEEVTNIPSVTQPVTTTTTLKVKNEGKEKWWTIGRGRKDSKEKEKEKEKEKTKVQEKSVSRPEPSRSKTPEPFKSAPETQSRARFNSLDSGMLLTNPPTISTGYTSRNISNPQLLNLDEEKHPPQQPYPRVATPTLGGFLAPPNATGGLNVPDQSNGQNSIALRAMRSMRSLARIGSWNQLKNGTGPGEGADVETKVKKEEDGKKKAKKKEKGAKEKKKGEKEVKQKSKSKAKAQTVRSSGSSFEVGTLAASPNIAAGKGQSLGKKKRSILGLGLPSTMRHPTIRSGSTTSSIGANAATANNRLSVESAMILASRGRSGSTATSIMSSGSSLRPLSTTSTTSRESSGSSAASVKWDEEGLETVKELRRKEKESKRKSQEETGTKSKGKVDRESRRTSEERKRTPISDVFPEAFDSVQTLNSSAAPVSCRGPPLLTLEEATSDGHGRSDDDVSLATPSKRVRPRPVSEQLLMKYRPRAIHEDDGDGVISILSAATNDLAQLINHLDLEATPGTTPGTPESFHWRPPRQEEPVPKLPCEDSPTKRTLRKDITSISSLRPYAQSRFNDATKSSTTSQAIGQQIAPWPILNAMFPAKDSPRRASTDVADTKPKRVSHTRTMSPPNVIIEDTPPPPLRALRPSKSRPILDTLKPLGPPPSSALPSPAAAPSSEIVRAPSSLTFGSRSSSRGIGSSISSMEGIHATAAIPNLKTRGHVRNRSSLLSSQMGSENSVLEQDHTTSRPLAPGAKRMLGMKGTMGGSDVSAYAVDDLDLSEPDSDIPDELQNILAGNSDHEREDTLSFRPPPSPPADSSFALVPDVEPDVDSCSEPEPLNLPIFHANVIDENDNLVDDEITEDESDHTKKSFDFTGELNKLNESGASDRRSFVEQLENAFKTPAKVDLRCDFAVTGLHADVPPLPPLPSMLQTQSVPENVSVSFEDKTDLSVSSTDVQASVSSQSTSLDLKATSISQLLDCKEPTLLPGTDSLSSHDITPGTDICIELPKPLKSSTSSSSSRPSDGELNKAFKFGRMVPKTSPEKEKSPMTLSDIIPPLSRVRALSDSSSAEVDDSVLKSILEKATEVPNRQNVPRPRVNSDSSIRVRARGNVQSTIQYRHSRHESGMSFIGFDSFEEVRRGFEFHDYRPAFYPPSTTNTRRNVHARQESTVSFASVSSYGFVLNNGVPDPFDYGLPSLRERPSSEDMSSISMSVDDTFSFMRHPSYRRRRIESDASSFYFNPIAPPNARGHRRQESNMSVVSQGPPISLYNRSAHRRNESSASINSSFGMHGANARTSWVRHRRGASADSVDSSRLSVVQLGRPGIGDKMFDMPDYGAPLTSISASPPESTMGEHFGNRTTYDYDSILDDDQQSATVEDSLFEQTGNRSSVSSDSVFGYDDSGSHQLMPATHYRPLSSLSMQSNHASMKEDDTMISMLGGGHVRRCSVGSVIQASPCVRVGKRKQPPGTQVNEKEPGHVKTQPSIASTSSSKFGGERMIRAKRGVYERQSLEEGALMADGEDLSFSLGSLPVFSKPAPTSRSRSSTCTSISSGAETPPLSSADGSSASEGSQSSIDIEQLNRILSNTSHPAAIRPRTRARARGQGHRRRISQARASRSSVYETIEEELWSESSPDHSVSMSKNSPTAIQPVYVVDPDAASIHSTDSFWHDESRVASLRRYNKLRHEAEHTVKESQRVWSDTPFSLYALQSFDPPRHPAGMQALLADSVQNYGPLPSELRPRRRCTSSRPSPYPQARTSKVSMSQEYLSHSPPAVPLPPVPARVPKLEDSPLQLKSVNTNISSANAKASSLKLKKVLAAVNNNAESPGSFNPYVAFGPPKVRPRVGSAARRTALGWSKRSTGKSSSDLKENSGTMMTPGETLRLSRPRPRGRPTPARPQPVRV
ncbi:hypothetical protein E1B28_009569 [Marasmius oreades]|uniref:Uncharacterized protein n=1 Tax=Marasmius oreades TaxID=181124 RepID=A0A9P7UQL2_9AGAR|nr:uncharacterized protein E1B28_009569 [Marasmius oreades]KAG7090453.1 hypothetical protein E1B28_009569 [Marasmius oreades]